MNDGKTPRICAASSCAAKLGSSATLTETCTPHMLAAVIDADCQDADKTDKGAGAANSLTDGPRPDKPRNATPTQTLPIQLGGGVSRDARRVGSAVARQFLAVVLKEERRNADRLKNANRHSSDALHCGAQAKPVVAAKGAGTDTTKDTSSKVDTGARTRVAAAVTDTTDVQLGGDTVQEMEAVCQAFDFLAATTGPYMDCVVVSL